MKYILLVMISLLISFPSHAVEQINLPTPFDMILLAGADYQFNIELKTSAGTYINNKNFQYKAQFRSSTAPAGILFANFSTITFANYSGRVRISLSNRQTSALSGKSGVWDLRQIDTTGLRTYLLSGKASVRPTVTQ